MITNIKKALAWLVLSSSDSTKVSMTVKYFLAGLVTVITILAGFAHVQIPGPEVFTQATDAIINMVQVFFTLVASIATAWGVIRKIILTIRGENDVVNSHPVFTGIKR